MTRNNVTTWRDGEVITRLIARLQQALMEYQMYAAPREDGKWGVGKLGGDSDVMVEAITLRNRLDQLIEKSIKANS